MQVICPQELHYWKYVKLTIQMHTETLFYMPMLNTMFYGVHYKGKG